MIGRILCRLGWHSWKPVVRYHVKASLMFAWFGTYGDWQTACICRRCRKRVSV